MTLKEAIERYTSNAEYERIHGSLQGCLDFRQLAEWLKDYERLLEQESRMVVLLEKTYDDFCKCEGGEGWLKIDGKEYITDVGYAFEGMRIFMEVFKQRLAESEEV